jgi:uncharacterized membrane protein
MTMKKRIVSLVAVFSAIIYSFVGVFSYAIDWGQNIYNTVQGIVWWVALAVLVAFSTKFIAKRMWVQFAGFVFLAAIVLVIIDDPTRLKNIGVAIWDAVFR